MLKSELFGGEGIRALCIQGPGLEPRNLLLDALRLSSCVHDPSSVYKDVHCNNVGHQRVPKIFFSLLQECTVKKDLVHGRKVHSLMISYGIDSENTYGNHLIRMYASCGSLLEANEAFCKVSKPSVSTWCAIISAHAKLGEGGIALQLYCRMQQDGIKPNKCVFLCVLKACSSIGAVGIVQAMELLNQQGIPVSKNIVHSFLQGCTKNKDLTASRRVLSIMIRNGLDSIASLGDQLIRLFASCGSLLEANQVFSRISRPSMHTWNAIISAHVNFGEAEQALHLYYEMLKAGVKPNEFIFTCILKACSGTAALKQGRLIHDEIIRSGLDSHVVIGNALVDLYVKCKDLEEAYKVFGELLDPDVVSWGAMTVGFSHHGHDLAAVELFEKMKQELVMPNRVIYLCILKAYGSMGALGQGKLIHSEIIKRGLYLDVLVGSTLIDMYAKCGTLEDMHIVFDGLLDQNVVSWGAMIGGYAQHGDYLLAAKCLEDMQQRGLQPDDVIFTSILTACSHAAMLEAGCRHFNSMTKDHGITPTVKHMNCLVDVLGRLGYLNEAEALLRTMPISPDVVGWKSLLMSCRIHGNMESGRRCFDEIVQSDPHDASGYVLMASIYCDVHMWEDVEKMQELRKCADAAKKPGTAWIEIQDKVDEFIVGSTSHTQSDKIYAKWSRLNKIVQDDGFVPQLDLVLNLC